MKILVTGANGYVGKHVLRKLLATDCEVVALVRGLASLEKLEEKFHRLTVVKASIENPPSRLYELCGNPDALIHLAWGGLPNYNSLHHFENELPMQYHFLKEMITQGLPMVTVAGTCFEYGMQSGSLREDLPTNPCNAYGYAKDALHKQIKFLQQSKKFNLVWARLFYTYGEGQSATSLVPQLREAIENGRPEFNMSGGEQLRDFLDIELIAEYLVTLTLKAKDIGAINVCSGVPRSVRSIAEEVVEGLNSSIRLNFGRYPYPAYEPMAFWGDDRLLKLSL
jgi:nucleoside-diphosphate-sugar epimerase